MKAYKCEVCGKEFNATETTQPAYIKKDRKLLEVCGICKGDYNDLHESR